MKIDTPTLSNAPAVYDRQSFDMMLGSLRSYFNRLQQVVNAESTGGGTPAGSSGEVQFNSAGAFGASTNLTVNTGTGALTTGVDATINGCAAGRGSGDVADNTVFGTDALGTVNTGYGNTVFGWSNLTANTTGSANTVVGNGCMVTNTDGSDNTVVGFAAGENITGGENVVVGRSTGSQITSGSGNLAVGHASGATTTGNNNVEILTITPSSGSPIFTTTTNSDRIVMGNGDHTHAYIKIAWTVTSDARDKLVFGSVPHGLDFVARLRPVQYRFRVRRGANDTIGRIKYGFLAQEVRALENEAVVIDEEDPDNLKYNESSLVPILVNAIKELKARIEALEGRI